MLWKRAGLMELTVQQGGWMLNEPSPVGWKLHKEKCKHSQGYRTSTRLGQSGGSSELCTRRGNSRISLALCQGQVAFLLSLSIHKKLLGHWGCVLNKMLLAKVQFARHHLKVSHIPSFFHTPFLYPNQLFCEQFFWNWQGNLEHLSKIHPNHS